MGGPGFSLARIGAGEERCDGPDVGQCLDQARVDVVEDIAWPKSADSAY